MKPYFKQEVHSKQLGSENLTLLMQKVKPKMWLSAHLHVEFENDVSIDSDVVHFSALDKPTNNPHRKFFKTVVSSEESGHVGLFYDAQWLTILK